MSRFYILFATEFFGLCSKNDATNFTTIFLITFGNGSSEYSNKTPSDFGFHTNYTQNFSGNKQNGLFGFVSITLHLSDYWHIKQPDHTENDEDGYMFLVQSAPKGSQIFNYKINNLCIGLYYDFFAFIANLMNMTTNFTTQTIDFEVRAVSEDGPLIANISTGEIAKYKNITWSKYGISFIATSSSVVLLMTSSSETLTGNDFVIDDIELRVCSANHSGLCPSG